MDEIARSSPAPSPSPSALPPRHDHHSFLPPFRPNAAVTDHDRRGPAMCNGARAVAAGVNGGFSFPAASSSSLRPPTPSSLFDGGDGNGGPALFANGGTSPVDVEGLGLRFAGLHVGNVDERAVANPSREVYGGAGSIGRALRGGEVESYGGLPRGCAIPNYTMLAAASANGGGTRNGYGYAGQGRHLEEEDSYYAAPRSSIFPQFAMPADEQRTWQEYLPQPELLDTWLPADAPFMGYPNGLQNNAFNVFGYSPQASFGMVAGNGNAVPSISLLQAQRTGIDVNRSPPSLSLPHPSESMFPRPHFSSRPYSDPSPWQREAHSLGSARNSRQLEDLGLDGDSLIIHGKGLNYMGRSRGELQRGGHKRLMQLDRRMHARDSAAMHLDSAVDQDLRNWTYYPPPDDFYNPSIYHLAMDQDGCRLLQFKVEEGRSQDVEEIYNGIIYHVAKLIKHPFGNYLIQKLLDVCNEEQRLGIILVLTEYPSQLVEIAKNPHGTRAVQKLIETLKTRQQIALVVSALKPSFLDLSKDPNGNHVIKSCLKSLSCEDNKFIFDAAAKHCVDIATNCHGCCVLQSCIGYSTGEYRSKLLAQICSNALQLALDDYGNFVVQYILELRNPMATPKLISQFEGRYVALSTQKFSSHVVEKCLIVFKEEDQATIIFELLQVPQFDKLMQDPYANYVIKKALECSEGSLYNAVADACRPHEPFLRTCPFCKQIFFLLKK